MNQMLKHFFIFHLSNVKSEDEMLVQQQQIPKLDMTLIWLRVGMIDFFNTIMESVMVSEKKFKPLRMT